MNIKRSILLLLIGFVGGFLSVHFFSFRYIEKYLTSDERSDLIPFEIIEKKEVTIRENEALIERMERAEKAVIGIRTELRGKVIEGSGLIVSSDGLIVTFSEIVPVGGSFSFFVNGEKAPYEVVKRNSQLTLIKIDKRGLATPEFGDEKRIKPGERVFLAGAVFNEKNQVVKSFNEGIVKMVNSYIRTNIIEESKLIGSSLFDIEGRFLGLNLIGTKGEVYSVPVSEIQEFVGL